MEQTTESTGTESTGTSTESTQVDSSVDTGASAPAESSTSTSGQETAGSTEAASIEAAKQASIAKYTPNFAFKVKDKEHQFDDFIKSAIRDADTEKKARELYEKAFGLDEVKAHRQKLQEDLGAIQPKYQAVEKSLQALGSYVQKKDYRSFFEALQIPKEDVIRYAVEELKFRELPPEQKAELESRRQQEQQFALIQEQNQTYAQQMQALVQKQAEFELSQEISKPEISQLAQGYDARVGKPGAFKAEVIRRGAYYETVMQKNVSANELVNEVAMLIGGLPQGAPGSAGGMLSQGNAVAAQVTKPTIKSFQGSTGASPVKKVFSSIDEIRKHRQNMADAN